MAYTITSESYGRRLPKITATADSTDDLAVLGTNYAEGSTCLIGETTYSLDKVSGWIIPGSGGGGSDLPAVTSDDNGDVLTVVEGAWAKAAPSGGAFIVHQTYDEATSTVTLDKTFLEIDAALKSGPVSILIEDYYDEGFSCQYLVFQTVYNWESGDTASPEDGGKVLALQIEKATGTSAMLTVYEYSAATGDAYPARSVS